MLDLLGDLVGDAVAEILIGALFRGLRSPFQRQRSEVKRILGLI